MRWMTVVPVVAVLLAGLTGGQELAPEVLLLARIKLRAAENLEKLPNYTCIETIERSRRRNASRRFELVDVLRLEVGLVNGKELFAWPGSGRFEDKDITDMVSGGAIGNGSFALHVRGVFLSGTPAFTYLGERIREGRRLIRYDYKVPLFKSGYRLRVRPREGIVGYHGAVWVDAETLDLVRLEVVADEIPPALPISSAEESLEYARVRIGEVDFLLPSSSELILRDLGGNESRNTTRFTNCRQFAGESVLSFADAPDTPEPVKPAAPERIVLPGGLEVDLRLDTAVGPGASAVGDEVRATVVRDSKQKGRVLIPKGAVVAGRLVRLQRQSRPRSVEWSVGFDFTRVEFENKYAAFHAVLIARPVMLEIPGPLGGPVPAMSRSELPEDPRIGILYIRGEAGKLPAGARMSWRTLAPSDTEAQP